MTDGAMRERLRKYIVDNGIGMGFAKREAGQADMLAFAASEVARERNRIKERVVTVMLAMHAGARLDAMADLIKELRDEP